jgi:hypothetical protein
MKHLFKIYLKQPVIHREVEETVTKKPFSKKTVTKTSEKTKTIYDYDEVCVPGDNYSWLKHDNGTERVIIKNGNGEHVFTAHKDDVAYILLTKNK